MFLGNLNHRVAALQIVYLSAVRSLRCERVGVRTEMKKERNCLDVASNSTMEVLGLTWNKNCMEEVGYYCTGPYLIHSCDKVYLILTHKKRELTHTIKPIQSMQVSAGFSYSDCIMARDHG